MLAYPQFKNSFITSIKHFEEVLIMIIREEKETRLETRKIVFLDVIKVLRNNFNKFAAHRNQSYFYEL